MSKFISKNSDVNEITNGIGGNFTKALTNPYAPTNVQDVDANSINDLDSVLSSYTGKSSSSFAKPSSTAIDPTKASTQTLNRSNGIEGFGTSPINASTLGIINADVNNLPDIAVQPDAVAFSDVPQFAELLNTTFKTFEENILDDYENITYNFKLALAPEAQLLNPNTNPSGPYYIVAQSGVTANFYIKSVDIESVVAPNYRTRNIRSYVFNVTIIEPQGISLIDKILAAGKELGIRNIKVAPMLLELSFKGYTKDGKLTEIPTIKRTWRVKLQDIHTKLESGGSEYILNFIALQDFAFNRFSAAAVIQQQITFPVDTVGQFFDDLAYYLTLQSTSIASAGQIARSEYNFQIDPDMRNWKIGEVPEQKNAPSIFIDQGGKRNIVLSTDMTIDRIVDAVLAVTKEGNLMVNPDSAPEKMNQQPSAPKVSRIASVNGKVEFLGFNTKVNDYVRKYTYFINKFDSFRALLDTPTEQNEDQRAQYLIEDALKKKYEYIFTGKNTNILNLDLDLNALWTHAAIYYASGIQRKNNISSKFIKPTQPETTQDDLREKAMASGFACTVNNPSGSVDSNLPEDFIGPLNSDQTRSDPRTDNIVALDKLSQSSTVQRDELRKQIAQQDSINGIAPVQASEANLPDNLPVLTSASRLNNIIQGQLIETLDNNPTLQDKDRILEFFTKQVDVELENTRTSENLEETTDLGRSIFGVVTNQLYKDSEFSNLLKIELEIRGDPFWLGESDSDILARLESNSVSTVVPGGFANYLRGENCFFLTFRTPQNFNDNTGFVDIQNSDLYIGVYSVNTIIHTFENGRFTQKLQAIRDLQTSAKTLRKYIQ